MLLKNITIRNFRCFENIVDVPIHRLTVFIGENDAGKTCILDALEVLLTPKIPTIGDFLKRANGDVEQTIFIEGQFQLEDYDSLPEDYRTIEGNTFILRKSFSSGGAKCEINARGYHDSRWNNFPRQTAQIQKELLQSVNVEPGGNGEQRIEQFNRAVSDGKLLKEPMTLEIKFSDISDYLPRFEKISSTDYHHPDTMVQRTFQAVVDSFIRPENPQTGERELRQDLQGLKNQIKEALDNKTTQMLETLRHGNPRLISVEVSPNIDFSRSVTATNLTLNVGQGHQLVSAYGEGTKKKLWMGLLEWEKQTQNELRDISVIRVYDEPDVNLDYSAERKLFTNIIESTRSPHSRTQAIICTHAVTFVDRAPGQSINLISVCEDGNRQITFFNSNSDKELEDFLSTIGRSVGLTNSSLFFERAFLIVEGESEENALPILYRNLYGRSLIEDGIVLIPLFSCGAWKAILNLLNKNKAHMTVLLLDEDCRYPESCARITPDSLKEIGYTPEFLSNNCFYIGTKEYEDAFATDDIGTLLNNHWPKEDGEPWIAEDIDQFRDLNYKFSEDLLKLVRRTCIKKQRNRTQKPDFALAVAAHCKEESQIPEVIRSIFCKLRLISGVDHEIE